MTYHKRTETAIAEILNSNAIPCVLSGPGLLALYGGRHTYIGRAMGTIDFVVPDHQLDRAVDLLLQVESSSTGFRRCPDPSSCPQTIHQKRKRLQPAVHLHADIEDQRRRPDRIVQIFKQSCLMPTLPPMGRELLPSSPADHEEITQALPPYYTLASDASMPTVQEDLWVPFGKFTADEYPVIIPKVHVLMELFFHAHCRKINEPHHFEAFESIHHLLKSAEYQVVDLDEDLLSPVVRKFLNILQIPNSGLADDEWDDALLRELGYPRKVPQGDRW